jgi:hypothetical protein
VSTEQVQAILDFAVANNGATITVPDATAAMTLRRQLYNKRVRHRAKGNDSYDSLYISIKDDPPRLVITVGFPFDLQIVAGGQA